MRVPPRLTAPERRAGRVRGKSDSIDALAVARAALREPKLDGPRAGEETLRELKLLVDHRDDLVEERRRCQQRLRWHLHELDPTLRVPLRCTRPCRLARPRSHASSPGAGRRPRCRSHATYSAAAAVLTRAIGALDRVLQDRTRSLAPRLLELPGCGPLSAAKLLVRDRADRPLPIRRAARTPRRRRTPRRKLRQTPTPPPRPWRQPPTQLRPAPHRRHPRPRPPTRARLPRTQTSRRQEPTRGHPLPQTTTRPHRLHDAQKRAPIDIGATLGRRQSRPISCGRGRCRKASSRGSCQRRRRRSDLSSPSPQAGTLQQLPMTAMRSPRHTVARQACGTGEHPASCDSTRLPRARALSSVSQDQCALGRN